MLTAKSADNASQFVNTNFNGNKMVIKCIFITLISNVIFDNFQYSLLNIW